MSPRLMAKDVLGYRDIDYIRKLEKVRIKRALTKNQRAIIKVAVKHSLDIAIGCNSWEKGDIDDARKVLKKLKEYE